MLKEIFFPASPQAIKKVDYYYSGTRNAGVTIDKKQFPE
jgi:hypothetical protein